VEMAKLFLSQCFFRPLPQEWHYSDKAFEYTAVFYLLVFWVIQGLLVNPAEGSIAAACEVILTLAFTGVFLLIKGKTAIFFPLSTVVMGTVATIGLLSIPILVWLRLASGGELLAAFYTTLAFLLWGLLAVGNIFRQLLAKPASYGFGVACAYALETYVGTLFLLVI